MPDPYSIIDQQDRALQERLAGVLELPAAEPEQRAMLDALLSGLELPDGVRVLEVGCGTGPVARVLAGRPGVAEVVGCDPSAGTFFGHIAYASVIARKPRGRDDGAR